VEEITGQDRQEQEVTRLASLTGWNVNDLRKKTGLDRLGPPDGGAWWERIWKK